MDLNDKNIDPLKSCLLDVTDKESIQRRHGFILLELQKMVRNIDINYQNNFNDELLTGLSSSLIDGTVFEIVRGLAEIQQISEKNMFNARNKLINDQAVQRERLIKRQKESEKNSQTRLHQLPIIQAANKREIDAFDRRVADELHRHDVKTVMEFEQKVLEQQETMKKAGVPGFYVTNNPDEIRIQMYIFEFIQKLSNTPIPN